MLTHQLLEPQALSVSDCVALLNQALSEAVPALMVEGEVASFKLNHGKYIFFNVKDDQATLSCFMMAFALRIPLEDGMRVRVVATPKLTAKGYFSLTVQAVTPVGDGSLQRAYQLQKQRLAAEGLFAPERKRPLPAYPERVAVVSSAQAAGLIDFVTIARARWPLAALEVVNVRVQGSGAADDIIAALEALNSRARPPQAIALVRGGGSADDLACFNDEPLVRAIAASRVPIIAGIGHEVDETLASLAADVTASTPSNAAELLLPSVEAVRRQLTTGRRQLTQTLGERLKAQHLMVRRGRAELREQWRRALARARTQLEQARRLLKQLDPATVLRRGYAVLRRDGAVVRSVQRVTPGDQLESQLHDGIITSEVINVKAKR